jgi:ferric-dicitrate binding protein FerR (iron transport regulator)
VLNVDSRLRYAPDFGTHVRDVYLEGEAFFEVEHDEAKPFVVHTARATARDLGTQFTVRAYGDTASVTVAVMEGIVALAPVTPGAIALDGAAGASARAASKVDSLVLVARDVGEVSASGRLSMQRGVDTDVYAAWTRGTLAFNDTPLREVVATLNRWYDADVRLGDASIGNELFTASFSAESLSDVIAAMSTVLHLRVERRGAVMALHRHAVR